MALLLKNGVLAEKPVLASPKAVLALEVGIRKLANELIDKFIGKGSCEFAKEFGRPLPVGVFLDIMALPRQLPKIYEQVVRW